MLIVIGRDEATESERARLKISVYVEDCYVEYRDDHPKSC